MGGAGDVDGGGVGYDGGEEADGADGSGLVDLHNVGRAVDQLDCEIRTRFEPLAADLYTPVDAQAYFGAALDETVRGRRRAATADQEGHNGKPQECMAHRRRMPSP